MLIRLILFVAVATAAFSTLVGCETGSATRAQQPDLIKTLATDASNEIKVRKGEPFALELPANAGTGYTWMVHGSLPPGLKETGKPVFLEGDPNRMGAPGVWRFVLVGDRDGEYDIAFEMRRVWETDEKPVRRAIVKVTVAGT